MITDEGHDATQAGREPPFADFLRRVWAGDESAAVELVQRYEPALRLEIRLRLRDPAAAAPGPGRPLPVGAEELLRPGGDRPVRAGQPGEALGPAPGDGAEQDRPQARSRRRSGGTSAAT